MTDTTLEVDLTKYAVAAGDPEKLVAMAGQCSLMVEKLPCDTDAQVTQVGTLLKQCKGQIKALEEQRKKLTRPILDAKYNIDNWFKTPITILETCEIQLKKKITDYHARVEQAQKAATQQLQQAHVQQDFATAIAISQNIPTPVKVDGISVVEKWTYNLVDISQVPRALMAVDDRAVREAIKQGHRTIPGLEVVLVKSVRSAST